MATQRYALAKTCTNCWFKSSKILVNNWSSSNRCYFCIFNFDFFSLIIFGLSVHFLKLINSSFKLSIIFQNFWTSKEWAKCRHLHHSKVDHAFNKLYLFICLSPFSNIIANNIIAKKIFYLFFSNIIYFNIIIYIFF